MHRDESGIIESLKALDRKDPKRKVFGSVVHQYRLNPLLPVAVLQAFEEKHGISLPEDYKRFITSVGNGGAGPYYGLFRFGEHDNCDFCKWEEGALVGNVAKPFPHTEAWNLPEDFWSKEPAPPPGTSPEAEDRMMEAWDRELEEHYWHPKIMNGAIPICHRGCALRQWLVVNGEQKGFVWNDDRADYDGIYPLRDSGGNQMTFSDWYWTWLVTVRNCSVSNEHDRNGSWRSSHVFPEFVFLWAMVVGLFVGLLFASWWGWSRRDAIIAGLAIAFATLALVAIVDWLFARMRLHRENTG